MEGDEDGGEASLFLPRARVGRPKPPTTQTHSLHVGATVWPPVATRERPKVQGEPGELGGRVNARVCWGRRLRVSLQVLPRMQLTDPIHPRFGGAQVRSQLLLRPAPAKLSNTHHEQRGLCPGGLFGAMTPHTWGEASHCPAARLQRARPPPQTAPVT